MLKLSLLLLGLVWSASTFATGGPNLGMELGVFPNSQGNSSLGVVYTYGNDTDGKSYLLNFIPAVPPSERSKHFVWNFYVAGTADFVMPWDPRRDTQLAIIQVVVKDKSQVETILRNQAVKNGQNNLFFVLLDRATKTPVYYLPVSQFCAETPENFKDLTHGQRCDQIINP